MYILKKWIEPIIHLSIWLCGLLLAINNINNIGVLRRGMEYYLQAIAIGTLFNIILFYFVSLFLIPKYNYLASRKKLILYTIGTTTLLSFTESLIDYFLMPGLYSSEHEPYIAQLILITLFHIFILALALAYGFTHQWIKSEKKQQEIKAEKLSAELNYLKAQVNPHFLFNMLNMAFSSAVKHGDNFTANIIEMIASQMRYMLYKSNFDKVPIQKEIEHINGFIELQKLRISKDIPVKIHYRINGNFNSHKIAPLLLIPFIENAFKHGLRYDVSTDIKILIECTDNQLKLEVSNPISCKPHTFKNSSSGIGLENVEKRLKLLYSGKYHLQTKLENNIYHVSLNLNLNEY